MTVSKRLAEKKVAKFEKNITRRGVGSLPSKKEFEPAHIVLILFAVLIVISFILPGGKNGIMRRGNWRKPSKKCCFILC